MSNSATITREQLRKVYVVTELGGMMNASNRFSYAKLGKSSYSFGQLQFDVDHNEFARSFLHENGFSREDISDLRRHGGLAHARLRYLNGKLQVIPKERLDKFTNDQLDKSIAEIGDVIDRVRTQSPVNAEAISRDQKLQLGLADYANQFGSVTPQLVGVMMGKRETLRATGITVQAGEPPTREDIQRFINATDYGHKPENARAVAGREAHFNMAMAKLGLGPAVAVAGRTAAKSGEILCHGDRGPAVHDLQTKLAELGYVDSQGQRLQADGNFGPATRAAVERLQDAHGLAVDGKAGPATWRAIQADVQALQRDDPGLLPSIAGMSSLPAEAPGPDDPRSPFNPHHALFDDLRYRFPDASDNRLLQFTAACHANGLNERNLTDVRFDQQNGIVGFVSRAAGEFFRGVNVDVKEPSPPALQSIRQIQQSDLYQAQPQATIQAQIAQTRVQAQQDPMLSGR